MGAGRTDIYYSGTVAPHRRFLKGKLAVAVSVLEDVSYSNNGERAGVYAKAAIIVS